MKKLSVVFLLVILLCSPLWAETEKEMFDNGVALLKNEQFQEAVDVFTRLLEAAPDNPDVYKNRGVAYMKLGEYDRAILDFEKTREIRPDLKGLYSNLGVAWYYKGEYQKAIKNYDMEITLTPDNYYAYFNRAICRAELNDVEQSLDDVNKALTFSPDFYLAHCLRGDLLARMGDRVLAAEAYRKAMQIDPDHQYAKDQLAALPETPVKKPAKILEKPVKETPEVISEPRGEKVSKLDQKAEGDSEKEVPVEKLRPEKLPETQEKAPVDDKPAVTPKSKTAESASEGGGTPLAYELQAGAYQDRHNAVDMENRLKAREIQVRVREMTRPNGKHWYLVRTGKFDSRASAEGVRKKIMEDLGIDIIVRPWGQF